MSDTVVAALITVAGMLGVVIVTALVQLSTTRQVIKSERDKTLSLIHGQAATSREERRRERILDIVSEIVASTDPEVNATIDYQRIVKLINRVQLLLDFDSHREALLNGAVNELGITLGRVLAREPEDQWEDAERRKVILQAHGKVIDLARSVFVANQEHQAD
jgi:energy-converting hydrogenase Eha subunit H